MGDGKRQRPDTNAETRAEKRPSKPVIAVPEPDFGPRYRVLGVLGKGGMGKVFKAYDTELKQEVAVKVVRADKEGDAALARFRREIALARKVTSPNVLRVYDLAEHQGLRFLTMELVDGEDLSTILKKGKVPLESALSIFRQVCAGLSAAHAQGVVHRDLKPHNVLVDREGSVRVADFGLARSIEDSGFTASGAIMGSPAYMSPEQVKGDPTDERSDIYSLGIMLFQLMTGTTPFQAPTPHAVMEMRLHRPPRPLREISPDAPPYLEKIVARCLQVNPSARYSTVAALLADLDVETAPKSVPKRRSRLALPLAAVAVVAVAAIVAVIAWPRGASRTASTSGSASATSIPTSKGPVLTLVLGFDNRTPEPRFDATLPMLMHYALRRSAHVDPVANVQLQLLATEVGADVKVDDQLAARVAARKHVRVLGVRGKIAPKGAGYALSMVVKESNGTTLLERTLESPSADQVVPTVARLAVEVRAALGESVPEAERELTGLSASLAANHDFTLGVAAAENGDFTGAAGYLRKAVDRDPNFALARVRLATMYNNMKREEEGRAQRQLALRAVDHMGERDRLKFLGDYYTFTAEDFERGIASYNELLAKWPNDIDAQCNICSAYFATGNIQAALEAGHRASADHPTDIIIRGNLAAHYIAAGDYSAAVKELRKASVELPNPTSSMRQYHAVALAMLGQREAALQQVAELAKQDASTAAAVEADHAMGEGRLRAAQAMLEKGIKTDLADKNNDGVELKLAMLAELKARRGDKAGAREAAARVTANPQRIAQAAMVQLAVGDTAGAKASAAKLATHVAPSRRALAKQVEGELLLQRGKPQEAMVVFQEAIKLADTPMAHFRLARASLDAKHYAEAYTELRKCIERRGEVANASDDVTGLRYIPLFFYYLAKAQEGLGSSEAAASYRQFLGLLHEPDPDDPYVVDARKHIPAP